MSDWVEFLGGSGQIIWGAVSIFLFFLGIFLDSQYDLLGKAQKEWAKLRNKPCNFSVITYITSLESPIKDITDNLVTAFQNRDYTTRITSTGARDIFEAQHKKSGETFFIDVTHDDPAMVELKSHHTGINNVIDCLNEWGSVIEALNGKHKITRISFELLLPYSMGIKIKAPKDMRVEDYSINFLHDNRSRINATVNNKITANSEALGRLRECFKALT
jgi:hypothetical protein